MLPWSQLLSLWAAFGIIILCKISLLAVPVCNVPMDVQTAIPETVLILKKHGDSLASSGVMSVFFL